MAQRRGKIRLITFLAVTVGGVALIWVAAVYLGFVRQQQELSVACSRLEAACRAHVELIDNLLYDADAFRALEPSHVARVRTARDRFVELADVRGMASEPERIREFRRAEAALTAAIDRFRTAAGGLRATQAPLIVRDLGARLDESADGVSLGAAVLEQRATAYSTYVERFPGSLVVAVAGLRAGGDAAPAGGPAAQPVHR